MECALTVRTGTPTVPCRAVDVLVVEGGWSFGLGTQGGAEEFVGSGGLRKEPSFKSKEFTKTSVSRNDKCFMETKDVDQKYRPFLVLRGLQFTEVVPGTRGCPVRFKFG